MKNVLVVYKKSKYELYRNSPDRGVRDFINGDSEDAIRARKSHEEQQKTLETVVGTLDRAGVNHKEAYRARLVDISGEVESNDLAIAVGGDGTFLEVSHYVAGIPLLGVNSDSGTSKGFYCIANRESFAAVIGGIDATPKTTVGRIELILDGKRLPELVLNDILVAHTNPAAMMWYVLTAAREDGASDEKRVKSSGLLVCTAAGSTAWMYNEGGIVMPLGSSAMQYFSRGIRGEKTALAEGLAVKSLTREGAIYVDGEHIKYEFTIGSILHVGKGAPLTIVGSLEEKRRDYA